MALRLHIDTIACNTATCAISGKKLPLGALRVVTTCGSQRDDDATFTTTHDPIAFLAALRVGHAANVSAPHEAGKPALAAAAAVASGKRATRATRDRGGGSKIVTANGAGAVCALTGRLLQPNEVVVLLPTEAAAPSRQPLAVALAAATELLRPVLRAIGREAAAATLAALPGLQDLDYQQRAKVRTALQEAAAAAEPVEPKASGGGRGGSGAAAVDAVMRLDDDIAQRAKRRRAGQVSDAVAAGGGGGSGGKANVERLDGAGKAAAAAAVSTRTANARSSLPRHGAHPARGAVRSGEDTTGNGQDNPLGRSAAGNGGDGSGGPAEERKAEAAAAAAADLDRERAELMDRNRRMLQQLQLPGLAAQVSAVVGHGGGGGASRRQASQRGVDTKRSRETSAEPPPPRRVSLRQRGVAADAALAAGIDHETSHGVQLVAGRQAIEAAAGGGGGEPAEKADKARHPKGELPFRSDNGDEATDAAFLASLRAAAAAAGGPHPSSYEAKVEAQAGRTNGRCRIPGSAPDLSGPALARLSLQDRDVAKVTKDGVTHLAWLPGSERLLLAAADKTGKVSLWDVDVDPEEGAAADTDGVLMFSPHSEYVSGMRWLGREAAVGPCRLVTAAYDGSIRALDLGGAGRWLELPAPGDPRVVEFSALEVAPDGRTAFLGDPLGNLDIVDLRAPPRDAQAAADAGAAERGRHSGGGRGGDGGRSGDAAAPSAGPEAAAAWPMGGWQVCARKINSLHLEPSNGHLLASSCSDGSVCVWDVRKLSTAAAAAAVSGAHKGSSSGGHKAPKPLVALHHGKSCHAAYWAADGTQRLLSTSYDNTLRIWAAAAGGGGSAAADTVVGGFSQQLSLPHNNQTGRWITPFRAVWNATCDAVLVGNMKRGLDVFAVPAVQSAATAPAADAGASKHRKAGSAAGKTGGGDGGGLLLRTLTSDNMTAIPSRLACHPTLPVVVAATSSGRCHVWR